MFNRKCKVKAPIAGAIIDGQSGKIVWLSDDATVRVIEPREQIVYDRVKQAYDALHTIALGIQNDRQLSRIEMKQIAKNFIRGGKHESN